MAPAQAPKARTTHQFSVLGVPVPPPHHTYTLPVSRVGSRAQVVGRAQVVS